MLASSPALYGLVLAAGYSSRMGDRLKALVTLESESLLSRAVGALRRGGAERVFVVTGHRQAEVAAAAEALGAEPLFNPDFDRGMFTSQCAGFAHALALAEGADACAVLLHLVDCALVQDWSVSIMAKDWLALARRDPAWANRALLIPAFAGRCGHPVLLGRDRLAQALERKAELEDQGGLRAYIAERVSEAGRPRYRLGLLPEEPPRTATPFSPPTGAGGVLLPCIPLRDTQGEAVFFPLPDAGLLCDLDTPDDCARAEAFLAFTRSRRRPAPEEAWEWLLGSGLEPEKIRHSLLVGLAGLRLTKALADAGLETDPVSVAGGGLLHDIAGACTLRQKKCKAHALRVQQRLMDRGWNACALTAGAHTALPDSILRAIGAPFSDAPAACRMHPQCAEAIAAAAVPCDDSYQGIAKPLAHACLAVYLADKYFFRDGYVAMDRRFGMVMERFFDDEEAVRAIDRRLKTAVAVRQWFMEASGATPESLLGGLDRQEWEATPWWRGDAEAEVWEKHIKQRLLEQGARGANPPPAEGLS
jgi:CTP:molybdopterin cytidylyltransferase MocA